MVSGKIRQQQMPGPVLDGQKDNLKVSTIRLKGMHIRGRQSQKSRPWSPDLFLCQQVCQDRVANQNPSNPALHLTEREAYAILHPCASSPAAAPITCRGCGQAKSCDEKGTTKDTCDLAVVIGFQELSVVQYSTDVYYLMYIEESKLA